MNAETRREFLWRGAILAAATGLDPAAAAAQSIKPQDPPTSQPESQPAERRTTLRKPAQADILKDLLEQQEMRVLPVQPRTFGESAQAAGVGEDGQPLLIEGTSLVERPGRFVRETGASKLVFHVEGASQIPREMEVLENQFLETMEREAEAGFSDFIISGRVTRYRGRNYVLLTKVLRRTSHGNLGP
jgi:hypothetical protein